MNTQRSLKKKRNRTTDNNVSLCIASHKRLVSLTAQGLVLGFEREVGVEAPHAHTAAHVAAGHPLPVGRQPRHRRRVLVLVVEPNVRRAGTLPIPFFSQLNFKPFVHSRFVPEPKEPTEGIVARHDARMSKLSSVMSWKQH